MPPSRRINSFLPRWERPTNTKKLTWVKPWPFLGLECEFPKPANDIAIEARLHREKETRWVKMTTEILKTGAKSGGPLESVMGRLSFSQTSIFGRFGRPMLSPLYGVLNSPSSHTLRSARVIRSLQWWEVAMCFLDSRAVAEVWGSATGKYGGYCSADLLYFRPWGSSDFWQSSMRPGANCTE